MDFKKQYSDLQKGLDKKKKELEKLTTLEKKARAAWTKRYQIYVSASDALADIKQLGTKKHGRLKAIIKSWRTDTVELTKLRDRHRADIERVRTEMADIGQKMAILQVQHFDQSKVRTEIVTQAFALNESAVTATRARDAYIKRQLETLLPEREKGNLTPFTIVSGDNLGKIVITWATIARIDPHHAARANELFKQHSSRFEKAENMKEDDIHIHKLIRNMFLERRTFQPSQSYDLFIAIDFKEEANPELYQAKIELINGKRVDIVMRVNLYTRTSEIDPWDYVEKT